MQVIGERMGGRESKRDLSPYRNLKNRLEIITQDPRLSMTAGSQAEGSSSWAAGLKPACVSCARRVSPS